MMAGRLRQDTVRTRTRIRLLWRIALILTLSGGLDNTGPVWADDAAPTKTSPPSTSPGPSSGESVAERVAALTRRGRQALADWHLDDARAVEAELGDIVRAGDNAALAHAAHLYKAELRYIEGRYTQALVEVNAARTVEGDDLSNQGERFVVRLKALDAFQRRAVTKRSEHFRVSVAPGPDEILLAPALATLEQAYAALVAEFGFTPPTPIRVEIYERLADLSAATGMPQEMVRNSGTVAVCSDFRIMLTTPRALLRGYQWQTTLSHELVHYFVYSRVGTACPVWLHEGLAKYYETRWQGAAGQLSAMDKHFLAAALTKHSLIPLSRMHPTFARFERTENVLAFAQVETLVAFLRSHDSDGFITRLLDALPAHDQYPEALEAVTGKPFDTLLAEWERYLVAQRFPILKGIESDTVLRQYKSDDGVDEEGEEGALALHAEGTEQERRTRLGNILGARGRLVAAREEYRLALRQAPFSPRLLTTVGRLETRLGDYDRAIAYLQKATEYFPSYTTAVTALGEAYVGAGKYPEAAKAFEAALAINPFNPNVYNALASMYDALGQPARAAEVRARLALLTRPASVPTN